MLSSLYRMVYNTIQREGTTATLTQQSTTGTYDPTTSSYTPGTPTTTTVKVVLLDYSATQNGLSVNKDTLIQVGDKQCYMDAKVNGVDLVKKPSPAGDTLTVNGETYRIMNCKEYSPTGAYTIMWDLLLRK